MRTENIDIKAEIERMRRESLRKLEMSRLIAEDLARRVREKTGDDVTATEVKYLAIMLLDIFFGLEYVKNIHNVRELLFHVMFRTEKLLERLSYLN